MPTYDYRCTECSNQFEEFQPITAPPLVECPRCGKPALKRVLGGGAGMIFKGSGFYLTDYKKSLPSAKKDPKPSGDTSSSASSPEKQSDAPPSKPD